MLIHMAYVSWFRFFLIISQGLCIKTCQDGEIKLVGGSTQPGYYTEGTIELCYGNTFGTVCSAGWSLINAIVVCRQLGYNGDVFAWNDPNQYGYGPGYGDIFFTNVACKGNESSLLSCSHSPYRQIDRCTHSNDAGVSCFSTCSNGSIRLLEAGESLGFWQGTIQMCYNNSYGTICSDGWDYNDAHVLCSQIDKPVALYSGSGTPFSNAHFGAGFGNILFSNFNCNGSEKTLLSCPHGSIYQTPGCTHDNDAGVSCYVYPFLTHSYSIPIGLAAGTLVCIVLTATAVFIACMRMKQRRIAHAAILHESEINQAARDSDNIASIKN